MKTFVIHNGCQLEEGSTFIYGETQYEYVYALSDGAICVRHPRNGPLYVRTGQLGLATHILPDWIVMNRRTGREVAINDQLPNAYRVERIDTNGYVRCVNGVRYGAYSLSKQVDHIERVRFDQQAPVIPEYKRGCEFNPPRDTGHMLINGEWRPYREVRSHRGEYYWEGEATLVGNAVALLADTVLSYDDTRLLASEAVSFEGKFYSPLDCEIIDGVSYPHRCCFRLVDSGGSLIKWLPPHASTTGYTLCCWLGTGNNTYAAESDVMPVDCGGHHPVDDTVEWGNLHYPQRWLDDNTFVCDGCLERFSNDDYDQDGRCYDCYEDEDEDDERDSRIRDCGCRTAARYEPEENIPLKFGIEFEVESGSGKRSELLDHFDSALPSRYAIYKDDGSLSDYTGVEIVTRPDSPAVHKRVWAAALDEKAQRLFRISDSCGIHIHVSRAPLSPLRIGRMLVFLNESCNEDLIRKVAGRYDGGYCSLRPGKKLSDGKRKGHSRYEGLNLTGDKTIEFRLFASRTSHTPEGFIKNIEFVEALLAFTNLAESGNRMLDTPSFMRFLTKRRKDYPVLHKFLYPTPAAPTAGN